MKKRIKKIVDSNTEPLQKRPTRDEVKRTIKSVVKDYASTMKRLA
jgi:hypothetical protein